MRKITLVLTCLACFGCSDGSTQSLSVSPAEDGVRSQATDLPTEGGTDARNTNASATDNKAGSTDTAPASAANAGVSNVRAVAGGNGWTFHVTVDHPDTGWDDYADGWDVVRPDGTVIKPDGDSPFTRLLLHPHENERPFTRSQSGIVIPAGVTSVTVRAHDLVDGFGGREVVVDLESAKGPGFTVER